MAEAKTRKKTTKKTAEKVEVSKLRKASLAYVGLYGLAYERAQFRAEQLKNASGELFETFVKKGEKLEAEGLELTKDVRMKATDLVFDSVKTVKNVVPFGGRDKRVGELEAEVTALNKKIAALSKAALSKKAATPRKTVKTETTTEKKAA